MATNRVTGVLGDLDLSGLDPHKLDDAVAMGSALSPATTSMPVRAALWLARLVGDMRRAVAAGDWPGVRQALVALWDVAGPALDRAGGPGHAADVAVPSGYATVTPPFRKWGLVACPDVTVSYGALLRWRVRWLFVDWHRSECAPPDC